MRLEKVPGGLRLAIWQAGQLLKDAPGARAARPARAAQLGRRAGPAASPLSSATGGDPGDRRARRQPGPHRRASRRAACRAPRRRPAPDRALDHAAEPGVGAPGGAGASARRPLPRRARLRRRARGARVRRSGGSSDYLYVPLKLVTGPANAAKAGEVLGGLRARLDEDPVLVVPDVRRRRARPARAGGARRGLRSARDALRVAVRRDRGAGRASPAAAASDFQRELIVEEAVRRARLEVLAESAGQPGFVRAAARFFAELGQVRAR